jgi:AcrR family transcriptional regulator
MVSWAGLGKWVTRVPDINGTTPFRFVQDSLGMAAADRHLRSDATRNREAILEAAIVVFADDPDASMARIAGASGTGRTTLYRHFPDRAALVDAIYERVLDEADSLTASRLSEAGEGDDPVAVVAELAVALAGLGDRYRFLEQHDAQLRAKNPRIAHRRSQPLGEFLAAGRRTAPVRDDLEPGWQFTAIVSVIMAASEYRFAGTGQRAENLRAAVAALLAPPPHT